MSLVLVVEDDPAIALSLRVILGRADLEVHQVSDGEAALVAFGEVAPDVVVLDVGLPSLDGWEVLARLRETSNVPVLMLSGYGQEADRDRGLGAGADDYMVKPFAGAELVGRVEALLRQRPGAR